MTFVKKPQNDTVWIDDSLNDRRLHPVTTVSVKPAKPSNSPLGTTMVRPTYTVMIPRRVRTGVEVVGEIETVTYSDVLVNESITVSLAYDPHRTEAEVRDFLLSGLAPIFDGGPGANSGLVAEILTAMVDQYLS